MQPSRRALVALGLSTLLVLGGCNGDSDASDEPMETFTPSESSSPSEPTSTYTPPEPAKPPKGGWPEDKPATEISAEQVARIWVETYARALRTGDASRLRHISTGACDLCQQFIDDLVSLHQAGGRVRFKHSSFVAGELTDVDTTSAPLVSLQLFVSASEGTRIPEAGGRPAPFKAENFEWFFELKPVHGRWKVKNVGFVQ
ncbi:hypothetical protein ncot_06110 [Nocardioides sp. JQ2195]|uniref:hypothetical protein n=1 Tax=Nocardioides sp. JQ2195 TaxID=2592334 RepID=UPI00143E14FA|nr:hypothetical protein [Nocardioides sp. JQ2195]QIX26223.1 hypothetical protein ncot_06110 [Nocardioides sp. JQ2195]